MGKCIISFSGMISPQNTVLFQYNEIFMVDVETDQKEMKKFVLDFDSETKAELVSVNEKLVKLLKPHQVSDCF